MDDNTNSQYSTNRNSQSSMAGQWGGWMQDYESGNYDKLPHDEISNAYRDWSRTASPEQRYEATYHGYQQLPQDQWGSAAEDLYNYCQDRNLDLSGMDLSTSDYRQWNAQDMAHITSHFYAGSDTSETESQGSSKKKSGLSVPKPIIGLALAGGLAYAASRFLGGNDKGRENDNVAYQKPTRADIDTSTATSRGSEYTTGYTGIQDQDRSSDQGSTADTGTIGTYASSSDYSAGSSGSTYGSTDSSIGNRGDYSTGSGSMGSSSSMGSSGDYSSDSDASGGSNSYNSGSSG